MSYEDYLADFRRRAEQRVAEFEQAVAKAEQAAREHDEQQRRQEANARIPRKRGRVRGILSRS